MFHNARRIVIALLGLIAVMLFGAGIASAEEPSNPAPNPSSSVIPEVEFLPQEVQDVVDLFIPEVVNGDTSACGMGETLEYMEACAVGIAQEQNEANGLPTPTVLSMPTYGIAVTSFPVNGEPLCGGNGMSASYCDGIVFLGDDSIPLYGENQGTVAAIVLHENGHANRDATVGLDHNALTTGPASGVFYEEQIADLSSGNGIQEALEAGHLTPENVDQAEELYQERLGSNTDATHGTEAERVDAFHAGRKGNTSYMDGVTHSSIEDK